MTKDLNGEVVYKIDFPESESGTTVTNTSVDTFTVDLDTVHKPYRLDNESYEDYVNRRKVSNMKRKEQKRGKLFWNSPKLGTYKTSFKVN